MTIVFILSWTALGELLGLGMGSVTRRLTQAQRRRGRALAPQLVIEGTTAVLFGGLAWHVGFHPQLLADSWLAAVGVPLAATDIAYRRLPNQLVHPSYPALTGFFGLAAVQDHATLSLLRALVGMVLLLILYALPYYLFPDTIGGGDVKIGGLLGLALGWSSWSTILVGTLLGWFLAAVSQLALRIIGFVISDTRLPLGAFLIIGAFVTLLAIPG